MMTSDISPQAHDYSSSRPTPVSERCEATLELGRKLTKELGLDQSVDTLGRWMAHYIAELMLDVEKSNTEERPMKMRDCCEAIFNLWNHRRLLSDGFRPFEELETLQRTLDSLNPENKTHRYYHSERAGADDAEESDETRFWLKIVDGIDYTAKTLIRYCLAQAAKKSLIKSAEWVALAEAAGVEVNIERMLVQVLTKEDKLLNASDLGEYERKQIVDRIERLENFAKMALLVASEMKK